MELNLASLAREVADVEEPAAEPVGKEDTFVVDYLDPDSGEPLTGTFVSRVPDKDSKIKAGRIMARLAGDFRFDDMPESWRVWAWSMASCATQLAKKPEWFDHKAGDDDALLFAVQGRLEEHASRYFRRDDASGDSATGEARVAIRAATAPKAARTR